MAVVKRIIFYGGLLLVMWLMTTTWLRETVVSLFGSTVGKPLAAFIRTNVEAPFIALWIAAYLDWVLSPSHRRARQPSASSAP